MQSIGDRIKEKMDDAGINQVQLAKLSGVGQGRITNILTRKTEYPQANTLLKIAKALKIDLNWMIGGEEWLTSVAEEQEKYGKQ